MEYLEQGEAFYMWREVPLAKNHSPWDNPDSRDVKKEWRGLIDRRKMSRNNRNI